MKFFIKLLLKAGVTLGVLFIAYRFLLPNMGSFQLPGTPENASTGLGEIGAPIVEEDVTVYKWTDEQGVTHFGGTPPTGQGHYEKKEIHSNANVIQAIKAPQEEDKEEQRSSSTSIGSVYTPGGAKELIDKAKDIQNQMDERKSKTDEILNSL